MERVCEDISQTLCQKDFVCDGRLLEDLECACMHQVSALLPAPPGAAKVPSGPYSSALSVAIAAGAEHTSQEETHIVGRAAVSGYRVWQHLGDTTCSDLLSQNSSAIIADWQQSQKLNDASAVQPQSNSQLPPNLMPLLSTLRCDMPGLGGRRAMQVPPSFPATHYLVDLYVRRQRTCGEQGNGGCPMPSNSAKFDGGRRLFQDDDADGIRGEHVLAMNFQTDDQRQAAKDAMVSALKQLKNFTKGLPQENYDDLLPEIIAQRSSDSPAPPSGQRPVPVVIVVVTVASVVIFTLLVIAICVWRRRRRPSPSPRTYVAGAQGASEPMLPDERREQLKGLLNFLRKKRTEEVTRARTRPLGDPVELGPEPAARTKVEHIVKALLCASAPGPIVAAEFP